MPLSSAEEEVRLWLYQQLRKRLPQRIVTPEEVREAISEIWELAKIKWPADPDG